MLGLPEVLGSLARPEPEALRILLPSLPFTCTCYLVCRGRDTLRQRVHLIQNCSYTDSTCNTSSSTDVGRPKIDTMTLSLPFSASTCSTVPMKFANGPS